MAKTNYNKMSEKTNKAAVNKAEEIKEPIEEVVPEIPVEETPEVGEVNMVIGIVSDCTKLNVRSKPSIKGEVVTVLDKGTEVEIAVSGERKDFYEVCALPGADYFHGFCMKKYITVKK